MNCKPGDLALFVRGRNSGQMVQVLHLERPPFNAPPGLPCWRIDRDVQWFGANNGPPKYKAPYCFDRSLMPIRPLPEPVEALDEQQVPV